MDEINPTEVYNDFMKLEPYKWFDITKSKKYPETDKLIEILKQWIDVGSPFQFSGDMRLLQRRREHNECRMVSKYHLIKELPTGLKIVKIERGTNHNFKIKHQDFNEVNQSPYYEIYFEDKLIAIEI